jgi:hypothetical protein
MRMRIQPVRQEKEMMVRNWVLYLSLVLACILIGSLAACNGSAAPQAPATQLAATSLPAAASTSTLATTSTPAPAASGIKGKVQEAQTGKAIASAYLIFKSKDGSVRKDTFADADGNYQIELPKGSYFVTVSQPGYATQTSDSPIETSGAEYITGPITLTPKSGPAAVKNTRASAGIWEKLHFLVKQCAAHTAATAKELKASPGQVVLQPLAAMFSFI